MAGKKQCWVCRWVELLVILGALNWGLMAIFGLDLVLPLFAQISGLTRAIYGLIGIAGVLAVLASVRPCPACEATK